MDFSAWRRGEPNNFKGPENYLTVSGEWTDGPDYLDYNTGYVCEWPDSAKASDGGVGSSFSGFKRALEVNATKLPIKESSVGFGQLNVSDDMIQAHAPSRVVFEIPRGSAKFSATGISWDEDSSRNGTWLYIVKIDGKQVFRSKALREYRNLKVPISVNIPVGAKEIELLTDTMGDGRSDHSAWESPMFR